MGKYDFLLIAHEHLYVFRKPDKDEKISQFKESVKWGKVGCFPLINHSRTTTMRAKW